MDDDALAGLPPDLAPWLEARLPDMGPLRRAERLGAEPSSRAWRLDFADGPLVLRARPPGKLPPRAHQVEREHRVMVALAGADMPVPRPRLLCQGGGPLGRSFLVTGWLDGRVFRDPALPEIAPSARAPIFEAMCAMLARLHALDPAVLGLERFGKPAGFFHREVAVWASHYAASVDVPDARMVRVGEWLAEAAVADEPVALIHGDWRIDDMVFHPSEPRIVGILAWEQSTLGHPLADLACQCLRWQMPHGSALGGLGGLNREALGLPLEVDYVAAYAARRGWAAGREGPPDWRAWLMLSAFRLAAILQGRVARDDASDQGAARAHEEAAAQVIAIADDLAG
jgi:aminoglycoside phosphotransferase (APT) family kinase protein